MNSVADKLMIQGGHFDGPCANRCGCGRIHAVSTNGTRTAEVCRRIGERIFDRRRPVSTRISAEELFADKQCEQPELAVSGVV